MNRARATVLVVLGALVPAAPAVDAEAFARDAIARVEQQLVSPLERTMCGLAERAAADKEVIDQLWEVPALVLALSKGRPDLLVPSLRLGSGTPLIRSPAAPSSAWPLHYRLSLASGPALRSGHPVLIEADCTIIADGACTLEILSVVPALATTTAAIPALAAGESWRIERDRFIRKRAELAVPDEPVVVAPGPAIADLVSATGTYGAAQAAAAYARLLIFPLAGDRSGEPPLMVRDHNGGARLTWSADGVEVLDLVMRSDQHGMEISAVATPHAVVATLPQVAYDVVIDEGLASEVRRRELLPLPLHYPLQPRRLTIQTVRVPDALPVSGEIRLADAGQHNIVCTRFRRTQAATSAGDCAFAARLAHACAHQRPTADQERRFRGLLAEIADGRERAELQTRMVISAVLGEDEAAVGCLAGIAAGLMAEAMPEFAWAEIEAAARWAFAVKRPALARGFLGLLLALEVPVACRLAQARRLSAGGEECLAFACLEKVGPLAGAPEVQPMAMSAALRILSTDGGDALGLVALGLIHRDVAAACERLAKCLESEIPDLARRLRATPRP